MREMERFKSGGLLEGNEPKRDWAPRTCLWKAPIVFLLFLFEPSCSLTVSNANTAEWMRTGDWPARRPSPYGSRKREGDQTLFESLVLPLVLVVYLVLLLRLPDSPGSAPGLQTCGLVPIRKLRPKSTERRRSGCPGWAWGKPPGSSRPPPTAQPGDNRTAKTTSGTSKSC